MLFVSSWQQASTLWLCYYQNLLVPVLKVWVRLKTWSLRYTGACGRVHMWQHHKPHQKEHTHTRHTLGSNLTLNTHSVTRASVRLPSDSLYTLPQLHVVHQRTQLEAHTHTMHSVCKNIAGKQFANHWKQPYKR